MFRYFCILLVVLCGCTTHQQRLTFKSLKHPAASKIKTYTYKEAKEAAKDSNGYSNFFLLPGIDPHQAYAFEKKFAKAEGFGYTVYTEHRVNSAWRTLDRVKFHMYRKKQGIP